MRPRRGSNSSGPGRTWGAGVDALEARGKGGDLLPGRGGAGRGQAAGLAAKVAVAAPARGERRARQGEESGTAAMAWHDLPAVQPFAVTRSAARPLVPRSATAFNAECSGRQRGRGRERGEGRKATTQGGGVGAESSAFRYFRRLFPILAFFRPAARIALSGRHGNDDRVQGAGVCVYVGGEGRGGGKRERERGRKGDCAGDAKGREK